MYPCVREWYQFLSFGNGKVAPNWSLYSTIPAHIVKQIRNLGHDQIAYMCLGVHGRGILDDVDWNDVETDTLKKDRNETIDQSKFDPLSNWNNASIVTTQCSNIGGVIEWSFVPFIVEDEPETNENEVSPNSDQSEEPIDEL